MAKTKTYGRKMLQELCRSARKNGIMVYFSIDENAKYVINLGEKRYNPPTAAAACHYVKGMIDVVNITS
jgi:hypothetical protein